MTSKLLILIKKIYLVYSNNPVNLDRLDEGLNAVLIGNWEKDISCGGCHLYNEPFEKEASKKSWNSNPKFSLKFPENTPVNLKITLAIADKNWKS